MKRGRKKKLAISLMDYMGKRRDMKRQLKKEGTAELYEVAVRHFLRFVKNPGFCLADLNRALVIDFITYLQAQCDRECLDQSDKMSAFLFGDLIDLFLRIDSAKIQHDRNHFSREKPTNGVFELLVLRLIKLS